MDTGFHFGWVYSRGWQRMGAVCLTFQETVKIFPKLVVFYIPTSKGKFFTFPENKSFNRYQICRCSLPVHGLFFKSKNSLPNLKGQIYEHFLDLDLDLTWETVVQPRVTEILLFASEIFVVLQFTVKFMVLQDNFLCGARYQLKVKFVCDYPTVPILFVKNILYLPNCISVSLSKVNQQYMCMCPWTRYPAGLTTAPYLCCYHTVLIITDWKPSWSRKSSNVVLAIENSLNSQLNFKSEYQFPSLLATVPTAIETPWPRQHLQSKHLVGVASL